MKRLFRAVGSSERGAMAVEDGALVMFIGLALVLALEAIGLSLDSAFTQLRTIFASAASGSG